MSANSYLPVREVTRETNVSKLIEAVRGYQAKANYCLGGSIPISSEATLQTSPENIITCPPIAIRFDSVDDSIEKIVLPVSDLEALSKLVRACDPATFGLGGKDVLDTTYRKAGKMDKEDFSTNFHPSDFGIVDAISQALLPGYSMLSKNQENPESDELMGVVAELYKLNVGSHFVIVLIKMLRRDRSTLGPLASSVSTLIHQEVLHSLEVWLCACRIPTEVGVTRHHYATDRRITCSTGGNLRVTHKGHDTIFDWGGDNPNEIKWAAFYSDCEHEALEVISGHRITLT